MRDLALLPKAHLHLHFTGSMRPATLRELAARHDISLPHALTQDEPLQLEGGPRGWFRFQRLYDAARGCVRDAQDLQRLVWDAAMTDAAQGSVRLELQIEPTTYAARLGGITPVLEVVSDAARQASAATGVSVGLIVAASRIRHPLDARSLARLAVKFAGDGPGEVCAFGLSNDERRGATADFAPAFDIARRAGLGSVPHAGELLGPSHVEEVARTLTPDRIGHGVRAAEDRFLLDRLVESGVAFEVCPTSNVALGVYPTQAQVPLRQLYDAGATIALGADDPVLFSSLVSEQYEVARRVHGFTDAQVADLARASLRASYLSDSARQEHLRRVDAWLDADEDAGADRPEWSAASSPQRAPASRAPHAPAGR